MRRRNGRDAQGAGVSSFRDISTGIIRRGCLLASPLSRHGAHRVSLFSSLCRHSVVAFCCQRLAATARAIVPLYSGISRFVLLASKLRFLVYGTAQRDDAKFLFPWPCSGLDQLF